MSDLNPLVQAISKAAPDAPVRLRQGTIVSVNTNGTATITIGGSSVNITNVKVASHACPVPGTTCWLVTDGRDWIVWATLAPAGPAWATMRQSVAQTIPTGAFTALDWTNRTETQSVGMTIGNTGFTCVVPGLYQVSFAVTLAANATGQRHAVIYHNGAVEVQGYSTNAPAGSDVCRMTLTTVIKLTTGDLINGYVYQSSGAGLATTIATGHNLLRATWLGPSA